MNSCVWKVMQKIKHFHRSLPLSCLIPMHFPFCCSSVHNLFFPSCSGMHFRFEFLSVVFRNSFFLRFHYKKCYARMMISSAGVEKDRKSGRQDLRIAVAHIFSCAAKPCKYYIIWMIFAYSKNNITKDLPYKIQTLLYG